MLTPSSRSSSQQENQPTEAKVTGKKGKRTKNPPVRIVGKRIYDPKNGKTCHQCRQKTLDLTASCKNVKDGNKRCTLNFCQSCLLNRYGEEVAEVEKLSNWICPRCKNKCICSLCRKKKGLPPTGPLARTAKTLGYKCVSDMLLHSSNNVAVPQVEEASIKQEEMNCNTNSSGDDEVIMSDVIPLLWPDLLDDEELEIALFGKAGNENSLDENNCSKLDTPKDQNTSLEVSMDKELEELIEMFNGTSNNVDDAILSRSEKRFKICNEVLEEDSKRNVNDCINILHEVPKKETKIARNNEGGNDDPQMWDANKVLDAIAYGVDDYLRSGLNFEEKCLKLKLEDEMSKADISNVSSSEHEALLSWIKCEEAHAHNDFLEAKGTNPKGML
ncbi:unnamed protein product [Lupinus luteus]|uniref:Zinc-finger domain-containing protein n=1 Tax=Lupinus luteus TaxID=3873 RepID=A0AAV1VQE6_LUPLU